MERPVIVLEAREIQSLYRPDVTEDDVREAVDRQIKKYGRFGLSKPWESLTQEEMTKGHWSRIQKNKQAFLREGKNISRTLNDERLPDVILSGLERGASVFSPDIMSPKVVLTNGLHSTNARVLESPRFSEGVLCPGKIGINMAFVSSSDVNRNIGKIRNYCTHEGNHDALEQYRLKNGLFVENFSSKDEARDTIFREGLATFMEEPEYRYEHHWDYSKDIGYWEELFKRALNANSNAEKIRIIEEIRDNPVIRKYDHGIVNEMTLVLMNIETPLGIEDELDDSVYGDCLYRAFVQTNGAAYHVGCHMFETLKSSGIDIGGVATKHPSHMFKLYEEKTGKNILKS